VTEDYWRGQRSIISSDDKARKPPAVAEHTGGLYFGIFQGLPWKYFPDVDLPELFALPFSKISHTKIFGKTGIHQGGSPPESKAKLIYRLGKNWRVDRFLPMF
jgi:hypothetical protein